MMERTDREPESEVAAPAEAGAVRAEVARLQEREPLASQGSMDIYLAAAADIPAVLHEIGRLREISFRLVGEGTGQPLDLDEYDQRYLHLFLWDRENERVAGAYRVGRTDQLIAEYGPAGLYCSTLFAFEQAFLDHLTPGLEVGRSFVAPDYQRSLGGLLGLWKGLAAFVSRNPRYRKLFGPVSISNDYTPISQNLMVRFLREKKQEEALAGFVKPYHPFEAADYGDISARLESLEQVSARVSEVEPDGKSIPVLLRQYLKLNATLLEFNVDPTFGNCLDALLLIDLDRTSDRVLGRYMGKAALRRFREEAAVK